MQRKEHLKKVYRNFDDFIAETASIELEYLILDLKFTTDFNCRIKSILEDIRESGKSNADLFVMFNTEGEIALIDKYLIGRFLANNYKMLIEKYYKDVKLNKIVKSVTNGDEKNQMDFLFLSFNVIYNTLQEIFMEIKCKKHTVEFYRKYYEIEINSKYDTLLTICNVLILEDICRFVGISSDILRKCVKTIT